MIVSFYEPLAYAVRNASVVSASTNDGSTEIVHFRPDLTDNYTYTVLITDAYGGVQVTETYPGQNFYNTDFGHLTGFSNGGAFTVQIDAVSGTYNGVTSPRSSQNYELVFTNAVVVTGSLTLYRDDRGGPFVPPPASLSIVADSYTTAQDTNLTVAVSAGVLANDTDANGSSLTAVLSGNPSHGELTLSGDGSFTYKPASGYSGSDSFTYQARDAAGQSSVATVSLTVTAVGPTVTAATDSYTTAQGTPLTVAASTGVLANDTDTNGGLLTAVLVGSPAHGTLTLSTDGSFTYTPDGGYRGSDTFTYKASDGTVQSATATVSLTITAVDHPVVATPDSYTISNASPSTDFTTTAATGVLANDTAADGGLTVLGIVVGSAVQTGFVPTGAGGQAKVLADGRLVYNQPFSSDAQGIIRYNGLDSFTYRVRDADGSTADATVTLTVGGGVDHPVYAADDAYAVSSTLILSNFTTNASTGVLANDYAPDGELVALGIVVGGALQTGFARTDAGGQAEILADGRLVYQQPSSSDAQGIIRYIGTDSFIYRVRDADGSTADATVTLTVGGGVNQRVFATNDSYSVSNASPGIEFTTGTAAGVLANDYAPDAGLVALGIVVNGVVQTGLVITAAGGQAKILADGQLVYDQPFSSDAQGIIRYVGTDSFTYRVRDGDGSTADATVTLTVGGGVNNPVYAADDRYAVPNDFPSADFSTDVSTGVLANDHAPDAGLVALGILVGGAVQTGFVRTAAGGQAEILADGRLVYRQPFSLDAQASLVRYNGTDSFIYRVRDGDGSTADATVTLTVGNGVQLVLTRNADTLVGTSDDDLVSVGSQTLSLGDWIDGGGGTNRLALVGGGIFNLNAPTTLTNIQVIDAQEGQAANGVVAATNQSITLRAGLDVTVNVRSATVNPANLKASTITINGANDASTIHLGAGNDIVTVGGVRETIVGGTGSSQIQVTAATIGAAIDGGSGNASVYVLGGGANVTMGSNITRITTVVLAGASDPMSFIANGEAGLIVNDLNKGSDTVAAGGLNQILTGGAGSTTFVGFAGGSTIFKNSAAAFNGDQIANFFAPDSQIDLTDMGFTTLQPLRFDAGILQVSDGLHSASMRLTGPVPAGMFVTHQDSGGGTLIDYIR